MRWLATTAAALLGAVGLAACSGSTSGTAAPTTVQSTTSTTMVPDTTIANDALLTISDLPSGWTSALDNPAVDSGLDAQNLVLTLATCLGVSASQLNDTPTTAHSQLFRSANNASTVRDQALVWPTTADADMDFGVFSSPKASTCIGNLFNGPIRAQIAASLGPGQTLVSITGAPVAYPQTGEHSTELRLTIVIRQAGVNVNVLFDIVDIVMGRTESTLIITQPQVLFQPSLAIQLGEDVAGRMPPA